ncbi:hypothetical protein ABL78_5345 [Leptomonas seymouri]|uniref:J domain-containing protein n=1 Tax=Leptomonas seymouri TaxID=5684 RepID=A0A0N0P554_LEPSE|nr:hypothetical protein ABL78_5345 [Leptomonas seymouri]|eukprot:KPI85607.1 hypothetical protein ABL78_5345 [Leptomonas seymouri]
MFSRSCLRLAPAIEDVVAAFKVLGLTYNPRAASASRPGVDDVRRQYREMARLHHPDLGSGDDNRMKVINTAYELIQSSGVLQGAYEPTKQGAESASGPLGSTSDGSATTRFARKAGTRRRRMPDDFASGDDSSWSMKTQLEWQSMVNSADCITEEEMKNPANHPFSHSRFFSFEEDLSIYRMIRGGATVRQVARTLGKPATFVERRLQNAQFKLRVQYVLRQQKRAARSPAPAGKPAASTAASDCFQTAGHSISTPITEPTTRRVLRRSPYEDTSANHHRSPAFTCGGAPSASSTASWFASGSPRKREWEASYPEWRAPRYRHQMTLEEQGRLDGLLRDSPRASSQRGGAAEKLRHGSASKMGRSYENFQRMRPL